MLLVSFDPHFRKKCALKRVCVKAETHCIPSWKLFRPQLDVSQLLDNIEKRKIPNQWCQVRSPFRIEIRHSV